MQTITTLCNTKKRKKIGKMQCNTKKWIKAVEIKKKRKKKERERERERERESDP